MKKIIGVVPKGVLFDEEKSCISDVYHLGNNYTKRILEAGGIPVCIAPVDGRISQEALEMCDGFIVQGGKQMWPYHFQVIDHAVNHGKRFLGICLGMQLIHRYFAIRKMAEEEGLEEDIAAQICRMFYEEQKGHNLLHLVEGHRSETMPRGEEDKAKHEVEIVPGTLLHRLMGRETVNGATFHNYRVEDPVDCVKVNAWATDGSGTIEGIEYQDYILGVQFHPEVDDKLPELFAFLTKE